MQMCHRCTGWLDTNDARKVSEDGKTLHLFCWWKLEQQRKELENANKVRSKGGDVPTVPPK